ncbi:MAG TPA: NAD-dependent epimerase/dehydratase family protein [Opitutaceae bacterium]|nr:NAD-dependent epimerase/dehydratase family protein [Opitutaceae bacterium]
MRVLITGARGFIGRNLVHHLKRRELLQIVTFTREDAIDELPHRLAGVDFVFHLAGVNRPQDPGEFRTGNSALTEKLCAAVRAEMRASGRKIAVLYTSSTQAGRANPYGESKREAEDRLRSLASETGAPVHLFRLPNVFGKWCRPNYNSAVATFCHNTARGLPITVNDPAAPLRLVYIDDVVATFLKALDGIELARDIEGFAKVEPEYATTVGEVAELIRGFRTSRQTLVTERVGHGFLRALHSTYVSCLPPADFSYPIPQHGDPRGVFVEMLKTPDCGQFSYFTAPPGVTRGGHYHHTKTEKFLVIKGRARFRFRQIDTGETHELNTEGSNPVIVETVPGWAHDITNVGQEEMVVMLWANEIFDRNHPDVFASPL